MQSMHNWYWYAKYAMVQDDFSGHALYKNGQLKIWWLYDWLHWVSGYAQHKLGMQSMRNMPPPPTHTQAYRVVNVGTKSILCFMLACLGMRSINWVCKYAGYETPHAHAHCIVDDGTQYILCFMLACLGMHSINLVCKVCGIWPPPSHTHTHTVSLLLVHKIYYVLCWLVWICRWLPLRLNWCSSADD